MNADSYNAESPSSSDPPEAKGVIEVVEEQFALRQLIWEYLIPVETNTIWYVLGGVLGIALILEILTGFILTFTYTPDAGQAYQITKNLIASPGWHVILGFHYFNSFLIFGLVMVHMMRVFISAAYRRGKQGLWLVGVLLAGLTFILYITGESLHWDEVGFAVPWHVSEFFQAIGVAQAMNYTFEPLLSIPSATEKLSQIYAIHISIAALLLVLGIVLHYYLIRVKRISLPFWHRASGETSPFSEHIKAWFIYGGLILGVILLLAIFIPRDPGTAPQLLPSSPFYGSEKGPGALGTKPSFAIAWTHGMNVFVEEHLGIKPDIWGTVAGMVLMLGALILIPFVDRGDDEPLSWREAFDLRRRGWAFLAIAIFWIVMIIGIVQNAVAGPG